MHKEITFAKIEEAFLPGQPGLYEIYTFTGIPLKVGISGDLRKRLIQHRDSQQRCLKLRPEGSWDNPADVISKRSILAKHLYFDSQICPGLNLRDEGDRQRFLRGNCIIIIRETKTKVEARLLEIELERKKKFRYQGTVVVRHLDDKGSSSRRADMLEKVFEDVLYKYPALIEEGLKVSGRQVNVGGKFVDLLFKDRHGHTLIVELKRGVIKREHVAQLLDYEGHFVSSENPDVRVMLIGNRVPVNLRNALNHHGFEWKEIPVSDLISFLEGENDTELLQYVTPDEPSGGEAKTQSAPKKRIKVASDRHPGYIRERGIPVAGTGKQAQALQLFLNGTTEEEYKKTLPGYSKSFNVMLKFFMDNGMTSYILDGRTFLKK